MSAAGALGALGLPELAAGVMVLALGAYLLMGGADFGGGAWDLLARGPRRDAQRALVADAIGPIWEANHVWLILVVVLLFTCFPAGFARITTVLHVPLTLMLVGIVLRGSAFTFRAYDARRDAAQRQWGTTFAIASVATPVLLGVCLGTLASGAVGRVALDRGTFVERFVAPWTTPFALAVGALALALCAFLAAVYLAVEAAEIDHTEEDPALADRTLAAALADDFRRRALGAGLAVAACAWGTLAVAPRTLGTDMRAVVTGGAGALLLQAVTATAAIAAFAALWARRWRLARAAAQAQTLCILWGWAWTQYPALVPPDGTIRALAAPSVTLRLTLATLGAGTLILLPSFVYLFRVFKARRMAFEGLDEGHQE